MKKVIVVLASFLFVACASTPNENSSPTKGAANSASATTNSATPNSGATGKNVSEIEMRKLEEARKLEMARNESRELQKQSVYFDFDKYIVKPEYMEIIRKQAAFIKAHKNDVVTLEGNADERGSAEYNLALGDKRANAVRKSLELLGVPTTQIKTASMGEEKPRLSCHEKKCWNENRRSDFIHKID